MVPVLLDCAATASRQACSSVALPVRKAVELPETGALLRPSSAVRYDRRFGEVKTAAILVLDDLGTESATPWAREKLYQLLNHRYVTRLPPVITTATAIKDLDSQMESRMMDENRSTFFVLTAPRYRGKTKTRRQGGQRKR